MTTFDIQEISDMSGLTIGQIEQAISRLKMPVQGVRNGLARQFSEVDAFNFCFIAEVRRLGIDWKRIIGSTAFPWPVEDPFEIPKTELLLLTPMLDSRREASEDAPKKLDISLVTPDDIAGHLRALKTGVGVVVDASEIAKRIRRRR
jgi:hypothetical protein